jgi:small subunit ribosomal protein S16
MLPMVGAGIIRKNYKVVLMVVIRLARGGAKKTSILSNHRY